LHYGVGVPAVLIVVVVVNVEHHLCNGLVSVMAFSTLGGSAHFTLTPTDVWVFCFT
jgi:hypothetical protein